LYRQLEPLHVSAASAGAAGGESSDLQPELPHVPANTADAVLRAAGGTELSSGGGSSDLQEEPPQSA
jgi:hypothetical protein